MKMQENTKNIPNIQQQNFGFGSENAKLTLFSNCDASGIASVYNRKLEHFNINFEEKETIQIRTIDEFCEEQKIERIHFLKLDVEGHELEALKGARNMLSGNGVIDFVQFEFGGCNIDSRTYFQDFWYLLKDNYRIYRILKNGIFEIKQYKEYYELFKATNFLAQRKI
jgi:FkbM family methyltransferase